MIGQCYKDIIITNYYADILSDKLKGIITMLEKRLYKNFCRKINSIYTEFSVLMESHKKECIRCILLEIEHKNYKRAFNALIVERDRIIDTYYGEVLLRYKIYRSWKHKCSKYYRTYQFVKENKL